MFSTVYASQNLTKRVELWNDLLEISQNSQGPQLFIGDFNEIATLDKRINPSQEMARSYRRFSNWIDDMSLLDMDFNRPKYTWSRGVEANIRVCVRLDFALCNPLWHTTFADASVRHLFAFQSDHSPLLILLQGNIANTSTQIILVPSIVANAS